jgi:hypothetical protein
LQRGLGVRIIQQLALAALRSAVTVLGRILGFALLFFLEELLVGPLALLFFLLRIRL